MKRLVTLSMLAVCGSAMAQTWGPGPGVTIPDNAPGVGSSITGLAGTIATFNWIEVRAFNHTWVGDLDATLIGSNGNSVNLFARPGYTGGGFGNNVDLAGTYRFVDSGGLNFTTQTTGVMAPGTYNRSSNTSWPTGASHSSLAGAFNGSNLAGTWTLLINDNAGGDTGDFGGWTFNTSPVPEPATMAVLGLGAAALLRRRRKA